MTTLRRRLHSESDSSYVPLLINTVTATDTGLNYSSTLGAKKVESTSSEKEPGNMSRDRSIEFANAVQSLQSRNITRTVPVRDVKKIKSLQSYGEFMMLAKFIGSNIAQTYAKLEKLTLLAKQRSLFNDRPTEIQELSYIIKEDLKSLNEQLSRLQSISKDQSMHQKNGKHHLLSHSNSVVSTLQSKVVAMSNEFKQVLDIRTENMKQTKTRRDQFTKREPGFRSQMRSGSSAHSEKSPLLLTESVYADDTRQHPSGLMPVGQTQLLIEDETERYLENRADTMQNIESTIVELGGIFQQLAHMVKEQDEMVQRIDANTYDVEMNVEAAHHQILKYFQSVTSNRWLMVKIFAVLMFFFTFFAVFIK